MRYLISTHGCYRKKETIDLKSTKLLMYAFENECIWYKKPYLESFCCKAIHKKKGDYKRKFIATKKYYQMIFGSLFDDTFNSYIQCCRTGKKIYDFKHGDLLLSDAIDIITAYNNHFNPSPIYISVLTCNTDCDDKDEDESKEYGEYLEVNRPPRLHPSSKKNWNATRKSVTNARRENMSIPAKRGAYRHQFKLGEIAVQPDGTHTVVTEENKKRLKAKGSYLFIPTKIGDAVFCQNKLWRIQSIQEGPVSYTLVPLLDTLSPIRGCTKKSKSSSRKSFKSMLSKFKSKDEPEPVLSAASAASASEDSITVDARETIKLEI